MASQSVLPKSLLIAAAIGVGVAIALVARSTVDDDGPSRNGAAPLRTDAAPSASAAPTIDRRPGALAATQPVAPPPAVAAGVDAPVTVQVPPTVHVGSPDELVVSVGANAGISEIGFTIRMDPDVLQARAGTKGDWAFGPGLEERFEATVPSSGDRVQVRSTVAGRRGGGGGGTVAVVQFEPVGRGTTTVTVSDLTVRDLSGKTLPAGPTTRRLQITAE